MTGKSESIRWLRNVQWEVILRFRSSNKNKGSSSDKEKFKKSSMPQMTCKSVITPRKSLVLPLVSVGKSTLKFSQSSVKCKSATRENTTESHSEVERPSFRSCSSYLQCLPTLKAATLGPCFIAHTSKIPLRGAYITRKRAWRLGRGEDSGSPRSSWTCSQPNWASRYPAFKLETQALINRVPLKLKSLLFTLNLRGVM